MEVSELTALINELGRDGFVARFPHLFLLFNEEQSPAPGSFSTKVVSRREAFKKPPGVLRVLPLVKAPSNPYSDRISIGRARNCDVVLRHPSVSKLHAHVRKEPNGTWVIIDLDSQNGTAVDDVPILPSRAEALRAGGALTFGGVTVRVVDADQLYTLLSHKAPVSGF